MQPLPKVQPLCFGLQAEASINRVLFKSCGPLYAEHAESEYDYSSDDYSGTEQGAVNLASIINAVDNSDDEWLEEVEIDNQLVQVQIDT